ncbi:MAG: DsrE family protein [Candidatus Bathyarchaeota archaeon]|nr:MAG: DsrE family protein [Candidatus Bathyarchaeota archaeon]
MTDEIIFLYGWGPEEEGRLSSLLYLVETASTMEINVAIFYFTDGAVLARKGTHAKISEETGRRFETILKRKTVKLYVCEQAARKRNITTENLENGITIVGYATFLDMTLSAKTIITI